MNEYAKLSKGADPDPQFMRFLNEFLKAREDKNNLKALDLGCGSLRNSIYFAKHGFEVLAVDIDKELHKYHKELPPDIQNKISVKIGDICSLFDFIKNRASYDFILVLHTLSFLPKSCVFELFEILQQIMSKNSQVYMNFWGNEDDFVKNKKAIGYAQHELKEALKKSAFQIMDLKEHKFKGKTITGYPKFWHVIEILTQTM